MTATASPKQSKQAKGSVKFKVTKDELQQLDGNPASDTPAPGLDQEQQDNALRLLLHPTSDEALRWAEFRKGKLTGELQIAHDPLTVRLRQLWAKTISIKTPLLACASATQGPAFVWFGSAKPGGTPSLSGEQLLEAVRRVLNLPQPTEAETTPTPKSTKGRNAKAVAGGDAVSSAELLSGVKVIDERDIPFAEIQRSRENPRLIFDESLIAEMAPTIVEICQLNPLTVRAGTFELIDGETRHRAGEKAQVKSLRCKVIECSDAQAACIRLLTSIQRRDLNPIERAKGIKSLQERHGLSQRQLKTLLHLEQGTISNYVRLLDLPDEWQSRVISGEITSKTARCLIPWKDEPTVLARLSERLAEEGIEQRNSLLEEFLNDAALDCSRPLVGWHSNWKLAGGGIRVNLSNLTEEELEKLRVRTFEPHGLRAFNIPLWEEMVRAANNKASEKEAAKAERVEKDPAKAAENKKKQAEQFMKKLYRFRTLWLQRQCLAAMNDLDQGKLLSLLLYFACGPGWTRRRDALSDTIKVKTKSYLPEFNPQVMNALMETPMEKKWTTIRGLITDWVGVDPEYLHTDLPPNTVAALAEHCDIDVKRDWPESFGSGQPCEGMFEEFLQLHTKDQLVELLDEWKMKSEEMPNPKTAKRSELVEWMSKTCQEETCPKAILQAKEVRGS